ncbi:MULTISPECIES: hypothetical protein [unclassified Moraxella]|uniref:O-linked N-acetylglucosamine transferase, SPINDLY family protein n=1 Tax=unclassified Moraxella TaxID=2685852 RepID=UPI003AF69089
MKNTKMRDAKSQKPQASKQGEQDTQLLPNPFQYSQVYQQPKSIDAIIIMARAIWSKGDLATALDWYDKALSLTVKRADIWYDKANILLEQGHTKQAVSCFDKGFQLDKPSLDDLYQIGIMAKDNQQFDIAVRCFERILTEDENYHRIHYELIYSTYWHKQYDKMLAVCDQAIARQPNVSYFYFMKGCAYQDQGKFALAIQSFQKVVDIDANYPEVLGILVSLKAKLGDWDGLNALIQTMCDGLDAGQPTSSPFNFMASVDSPQQQIFCSQSFLQRNGFIEKPLAVKLGVDKPFDFSKQANSRIKIAYVSADFFNHATAILMAELFELHDKSRFEVYAYSYGINVEDEWRIRLRNAFEYFYEVSEWDDESIAQHIYDEQISIVIDLKGYTGQSRTNIFAYRPAPIQINYIGYPGTMGASFIDYIIADNTLIPPHLEQFYTEKVIKLPHSYQPNDRHRIIGSNVPTKQQAGLPEEAFVFCCFNNPFKIMPETFAVWMRILHQVPNSVLWLLRDVVETENNLREQAKLAGIDPNRLVFADRVLVQDHLARHQLADLFLDTLPCNAHTTTSDALWAGLPVLTCLGQSFASRVAGSLLHACELDELITESMADYETLAVALATNSDKLTAIKQRLQTNREHYPLFDTVRYTKNLESAYQQIFEQAKQGKKPETLLIMDTQDS